MGIYWRYLKSIITHKYYVLLAGLRLKISIWQLLLHDWQKFTPLEFGRYARNFFGGGDPEFPFAWLHHENTAPHHWGYWIPRSGKHADQPLPMPMRYVREMVADWMGASKTYTGSWDMAEWLEKSVPNFRLHEEARGKLKRVLGEAGYDVRDVDIWLALHRADGASGEEQEEN